MTLACFRKSSSVRREYHDGNPAVLPGVGTAIRFLSDYTACILPMLLIVLLTALVLQPVSAGAQELLTSTVLVQFDPHIDSAARAEIIDSMGGQLIDWLPQIQVAEILLPDQDNVVSSASLAVLAAETSAITFAEADIVLSGTYSPNDPDFGNPDRSYAPQLLDVETAWDYTTGASDVVVAVLDTGLALVHPEFAGRIVDGYDFINDDAEPSDDHGHGTHAAGIIAAAADNGQGTAGICPNCSIMPIKVLDQSNIGNWSGVAQGVLYAVDHGADVINLSLGADRKSRTVTSAIEYAQENDVLVVAAAGNHGRDDLFYPAATDGVLGVGATDEKDARWALSNYGSYIDLVAPGHIIYSTYHDLDNVYGGYAFMSGTSMASPQVAGTAGLILSRNPALHADEVAVLLTGTALDLGDTDWDPKFGYGRVSAGQALIAASALITDDDPAEVNDITDANSTDQSLTEEQNEAPPTQINLDEPLDVDSTPSDPISRTTIFLPLVH